jgi:hypothetical protein
MQEVELKSCITGSPVDCPAYWSGKGRRKHQKKLSQVMLRSEYNTCFDTDDCAARIAGVLIIAKQGFGSGEGADCKVPSFLAFLFQFWAIAFYSMLA